MEQNSDGKSLLIAEFLSQLVALASNKANTQLVFAPFKLQGADSSTASDNNSANTAHHQNSTNTSANTHTKAAPKRSHTSSHARASDLSYTTTSSLAKPGKQNQSKQISSKLQGKAGNEQRAALADGIQKPLSKRRSKVIYRLLTRLVYLAQVRGMFRNQVEAVAVAKLKDEITAQVEAKMAELESNSNFNEKFGSRASSNSVNASERYSQNDLALWTSQLGQEESYQLDSPVLSSANAQAHTQSQEQASASALSPSQERPKVSLLKKPLSSDSAKRSDSAHGQDEQQAQTQASSSVQSQSQERPKVSLLKKPLSSDSAKRSDSAHGQDEQHAQAQTQIQEQTSAQASASAQLQFQERPKVSLLKKPLSSDSAKQPATSSGSNRNSEYHGSKVSLKKEPGGRLRHLLEHKLDEIAVEYISSNNAEASRTPNTQSSSLHQQPAATSAATVSTATSTTTSNTLTANQTSVSTSKQSVGAASKAKDSRAIKANTHEQPKAEESVKSKDNVRSQAKAQSNATNKTDSRTLSENKAQTQASDNAQSNSNEHQPNVTNATNIANQTLGYVEQSFASQTAAQKTAHQNGSAQQSALEAEPKNKTYRVLGWTFFTIFFCFVFGGGVLVGIEEFNEIQRREAAQKAAEEAAYKEQLKNDFIAYFNAHHGSQANPSSQANSSSNAYSSSQANSSSNTGAYAAVNDFPEVNAGSQSPENSNMGLAARNNNVEPRFEPIEPLPASKVNELIKFNMLEIVKKITTKQQLSPMEIAGWKFSEHKKRVEDFYQQIGIIFTFVQNDEWPIEQLQQALNSTKKPLCSLTADELNRLQQALMDGPEAIMQLPFGSLTPASSKVWCMVVNSELGTAESQENVIFPTPYHRGKANRWIDWYNHKCVGQSKINYELALLSQGQVDSLLMRLTALLKMSLMPHTAQVYPYSAKPGRAEVSRVQLVMNQLNLNVGQPDGIAGAKTKKQISELKKSILLVKIYNLQQDLAANPQNQRDQLLLKFYQNWINTPEIDYAMFLFAYVFLRTMNPDEPYECNFDPMFY